MSARIVRTQGELDAALADLRPIAGGTPKAKAPRVVVACREVDIDGKEVQR